MLKNKKGFTLIELLVVIAIIGLLSSVVFASLNSARGKARDAKRKTDLNIIAKAMELYFDSNNTYDIPGAGAGSTNGWFNHDYDDSGPLIPVAHKLRDLGLVGGIIIDPSGNVAGYSGTGSAYLIDGDQNDYTIWTSLENPSASDAATQNTCSLNTYDSYSSSFPAERRMNYCRSN